MHSVLELAQHRAAGVEELYPHRRILYIGSESYDAPTITVLQGLQELGFQVLVVGRSNVNSWFCEKIIDRYEGQPIDFCLSNLHWGTRWDYYANRALEGVPRILVDGDDNCDWNTWLGKYREYCDRYRVLRPHQVPAGQLKPYRYVVDLGDYRPDVVFTAQKPFRDPNDTLYLPFGVHREYLAMSEMKPLSDRRYDVVHFVGPGKERKLAHRAIRFARAAGLIRAPFSGSVRGQPNAPEPIRERCLNDENVHSYHRWIAYSDYFDMLNNAQLVLYPGVDAWPFWDSKRPWEAMACGALILMKSPTIDVSQYPITEVCPDLVYRNNRDLLRKLWELRHGKHDLAACQESTLRAVTRYFSPLPIARYFLRQVAERLALR